MRRFAFKKLIRDKIIDNMINSGQKPVYHVMDDKEYLLELKKKLAEEVQELSTEDNSRLLEEIADLQEIIDCLIKALNTSKKALKEIQSEKNGKRGSFKKRIYVESVGGPENSEFLDYYLKFPEKYPEIKD